MESSKQRKDREKREKAERTERLVKGKAAEKSVGSELEKSTHSSPTPGRDEIEAAPGASNPNSPAPISRKLKLDQARKSFMLAQAELLNEMKETWASQEDEFPFLHAFGDRPTEMVLNSMTTILPELADQDLMRADRNAEISRKRSILAYYFLDAYNEEHGLSLDYFGDYLTEESLENFRYFLRVVHHFMATFSTEIIIPDDDSTTLEGWPPVEGREEEVGNDPQYDSDHDKDYFYSQLEAIKDRERLDAFVDPSNDDEDQIRAFTTLSTPDLKIVFRKMRAELRSQMAARESADTRIAVVKVDHGRTKALLMAANVEIESLKKSGGGGGGSAVFGTGGNMTEVILNARQVNTKQIDKWKNTPLLVALLKDIRAQESLYTLERVLNLLTRQAKEGVKEELIRCALLPLDSQNNHFNGSLKPVPLGPGVSTEDDFWFFHRDGDHVPARIISDILRLNNKDENGEPLVSESSRGRTVNLAELVSKAPAKHWLLRVDAHQDDRLSQVKKHFEQHGLAQSQLGFDPIAAKNVKVASSEPSAEEIVLHKQLRKLLTARVREIHKGETRGMVEWANKIILETEREFDQLSLLFILDWATLFFRRHATRTSGILVSRELDPANQQQPAQSSVVAPGAKVKGGKFRDGKKRQLEVAEGVVEDTGAQSQTKYGKWEPCPNCGSTGQSS